MPQGRPTERGGKRSVLKANNKAMPAAKAAPPNSAVAAGAMRLQRYLSQSGVAARRKAEEMILAGRITVNDVVVRELGTKVDPATDRVLLDGQAVYPEEYFYIILNKPKGCITAVTDDQGRPTVMDYLPNVPVAVKPVGRLDFYSEGVLLLTNDGEMASRLLAPKSHVPKTYHVKVHGILGPRELNALKAGVKLDDGTVTQPAEVVALPGESKHSWVAITLYEGKSRQIHRMMEALGFVVQKLQRVAFANLTFHGLRVGDARELNQLELNELRDILGMDHATIARGAWSADREETDPRRKARAKQRLEEEMVAAEAAGVPFSVKTVEAPAPRVAPGPVHGRGEPSAFRGNRGPNDYREPSRNDTRDSRDARGPRRDARPDSRGPSRPDARGTSRPDARGPSRPDSRGPARPDSRGPARSDSRGPSRPDSRGPARPDARGPSRPDSRSRSSAPPSRGRGAPPSRGGGNRR